MNQTFTGGFKINKRQLPPLINESKQQARASSIMEVR